MRNAIFICVGEPSGDLYAGFFAAHLKKQRPDIKMYGVGSDGLRRSGVEIVADYHKLMTFGFSRGIYSYLRNYAMYREIARRLCRIRPKVFIAVAYPGMNLPLCRYAKRLGCTTYYFLPPQIWVWGGFRKYFIKKWVDKVISVFPFEYEYYRKNGVAVEYFENPLIAELKGYKRNDFQKRIGFMPGSRPSEIKRNVPIIMKIISMIDQEKDDMEFCLILRTDSLKLSRASINRSRKTRGSLRESRLPRFDPGSERALIEEVGLEDSIPAFKIITKNHYQAMKNCDLLILSSGTASLEAAMMEIPQIFFNRPSFLDFYVVRRFIKTKEYNLANLYFKKRVVSSFVSCNSRYILQNIWGILGTCLFN